MTRLRLTCSECGGTNLTYEGPIRWDEEKQEWKIHGFYDDVFCEDCGEDVDVDEEDLDAVNETGSG